MNIIINLPFIFIFVFRIIADLLFFQQNSYNNKIHFKWLTNHIKRYFWTILLFIFGIITLFLKVNVIIILIVLLLTIINLIPPTKPIKPLVWTPRAIRLLATSLIFFAVLMYFLGEHKNVSILFMLYILTPFILLIANIINSPIERIIKKKYINEAKKIINSHRDITVIGITGSYGKTSVKNFLYSFLSEKYNVLKTPKNYNTTMGVVKTIRENLKSTHEIFICEMGATHKGDIDEICGIVNPKIGILTGIAPIHLETFKTLDTLLSTKLELANYVKKLYYNKDNKELKTAVPKNSIGYSVNDVNGIKMSSDGTIFGNYKTSLIGKSNIQNLLGSIKVAQNEFNITENEINNALRTIRPIMHRQELKTVDIRTNIIDDAYNSNPIGSKAALDTLSMFNYDYKIVITPGMIDLGKRQEIENYKFGQNISNIADFVILVGAKWTLPIKQAFVDNNFTEYKIYNTMESAINYAMSIKAKKHKTILIENDLPDNYL